MRVSFAASALVVVAGALASACSGDEDPASVVYSGEQGYAECLQDAGLTADEIALFTEREPGDSQRLTSEDLANVDGLAEASAECASESGIGESGLTPERVAERTAANLGLVDCMRRSGWREFPDPVPGIGGSLVVEGVAPPADADQQAQFTDDLNECSIEHFGVPLQGGPGDDEHDHGDHDGEHDH